MKIVCVPYSMVAVEHNHSSTKKLHLVASISFLGLIVQPNRRYSKIVDLAFHVSTAVLDISSAHDDTEVQLILRSDNVDYILCILRRSGTVQVPLDLMFSHGDEIAFRSIGKSEKKLSITTWQNKNKKFNTLRRYCTFDWIRVRRRGREFGWREFKTTLVFRP